MSAFRISSFFAAAVVALMITLTTNAQDGPATNSPNRQLDYAPSPKATAVTEYGKIEPDLHTGALSFDIPIYTYKDQDFEIPISLHYYSSGLRPSSPSGEAGLGWSLVAGGAITREIVGIDDFGSCGRWGNDLSHRNVYQMTDSVSTAFIVPELNADYAETVIYFQGGDIRETTSDIYHFSFPGHSGSFVIGDDGASFKVYGCNNGESGTYSITSEYTPQGRYFIITTGDGTQWRFGCDQKAIEMVSRRNGVADFTRQTENTTDMPVVTWLLDQITAPDGRMAVFSYDRTYINNNSIPDDGTDVLTTFGRGRCRLSDPFISTTLYRTSSLVYTTYLSSIKVSGPCGEMEDVADFLWKPRDKEVPQDSPTSDSHSDEYNCHKMVVSGKKLKFITINLGSIRTRTASLTYAQSGRRPLLTKVVLSNGDQWEMNYKLPSLGDLPDQMATGIDYWGYYNGRDTTPFNSIFPTEINTDNCDETIPASRTFMDPDANYSVLGTLSSIRWPTGGTTSITWEANRADKIVLRRHNTPATPYPVGGTPSGAPPYVGALYPVSDMLHSDEVGGVRVASITDSLKFGAISTRFFTYTTSDGGSSGIVQQFNRYLSDMKDSIPQFNPYLKYPGSGFDRSHIGYRRVTETFPDGSRRQTEFSSWEDCPDGYSPHHRQYFSESDWSSQYRVFINNILREPNSQAYRRGLPLRRTVLDADNHILEETVMEYGRVGLDSVCYVVGSGEYWWSARRDLCDMLPSRVIRRIFPSADAVALVDTTRYAYDNLGRLSSEIVTEWDGSVRKKETTWLSASSGSAPRGLPSSETESARRGWNASFSLVKKEDYSWSQSAPGSSLWNLAEQTKTLFDYSGSGTVAGSASFSAFDTCGNARQISYNGGQTEAWIWGWGGRYPLARVRGCTWSDLPSSLQGMQSGNLTDAQDSLLYGIANVLVDSWGWQYNNGLSSVKDPARRGRWYLYDYQGRPSSESDSKGLLHNWDYGFESGLKTLDQTTLNNGKTLTERTVYDGLGREWLQIKRKGYGTEKDLAQYRFWDNMGNESRVYLPYAASVAMANSTLGQQQGYWAQTFGNLEATKAFTKRTYRPGPQARLSSETLPGRAFHDADRKTTHSYRANMAGEIPLAAYDESTGAVSINTHYPANVLLCTQEVTADGDSTFVFTNMDGEPVLERRVAGTDTLDTHYVRDLAGRPVWILSPGIGEAVRNAATGQGLTLSPDSDNAKAWCYVYTYSKKGDLSSASVPGGGKRAFRYDVRRRLIAEENPMLDNKDYYIQYTYDDLDRLTGSQLYKRYTHPGLRIPPDPQMSVDTLIHSLTSVEYANSATPYADVPSDMAFCTVPGVVAQADVAVNPHGETILTKEWLLTGPYTEELVHGPHIVTGKRAGISDLFVQTVFYYDTLGRVVQQVRKETDGGISRQSFAYDHIGNILASAEEHGPGGLAASDWILTENEYDNRNNLRTSGTWSGRGTTVDKDAADVEMSLRYAYDGLDRVVADTLYCGGHYVSTLYNYTVQGWSQQHITAVDGTTVFQETISHHDVSPGLARPRYDGNVSMIHFTEGNDSHRDYLYYDGFGRLSGTTAAMNPSLPARYGLFESGYSYDPSGNLLSLSRFGPDSTMVVNLSFVRDGNRLTQLTDSISGGDWSYSHDEMGHLSSDGRLGKTLAWNVCGGLQAAGNRSRFSFPDGTVYQENGPMYVLPRVRRGSCFYDKIASLFNGTTYNLISFAIPGGRVMNSGGTVRTLTPYAYVTDHLGSIRAVIDLSSGSVVERNNYYPYGGVITTSPAGTPYPQLASNYFGFSGKENQGSVLDVDYWDFGARLYDPFTASWIATDQLADQYPSISPYVYCAANPLNYVDPDGRDLWSVNKNGDINWIAPKDESILYAVDDNGAFVRQLKMNSDNALSSLSRKESDTVWFSSNNDNDTNDIKKLFVFLADNTDVEWALHHVNQCYTLGTHHESSNAGSWQDYGITTRPNESIHSHPGITPQERDERYSMQLDYYYMRKYPSTKAPRYFIYFPNSKTVYRLTSQYAEKTPVSIYNYLRITPSK